MSSFEGFEPNKKLSFEEVVRIVRGLLRICHPDVIKKNNDGEAQDLERKSNNFTAILVYILQLAKKKVSLESWPANSPYQTGEQISIVYLDECGNIKVKDAKLPNSPLGLLKLLHDILYSNNKTKQRTRKRAKKHGKDFDLELLDALRRLLGGHKSKISIDEIMRYYFRINDGSVLRSIHTRWRGQVYTGIINCENDIKYYTMNLYKQNIKRWRELEPHGGEDEVLREIARRMKGM